MHRNHKISHKKWPHPHLPQTVKLLSLPTYFPIPLPLHQPFCAHTHMLVESSWNVIAHGDAREGKWRRNWQMEWVASTLHTTSEHGVSSITTADAHISPSNSGLNWRPRRFKWTRQFRRKTKSGFCSCAITFQSQSTDNIIDKCFGLIQASYSSRVGRNIIGRECDNPNVNIPHQPRNFLQRPQNSRRQNRSGLNPERRMTPFSTSSGRYTSRVTWDLSELLIWKPDISQK
jgi:hypothetical protein